MALGSTELSAEESASTFVGPVVVKPVKHDTSPPLRDIEELPTSKVHYLRPEHKVPAGLNQVPEGWSGIVGVRHSPHVLQDSHSPRRAMPSTVVNSEGLGDGIAGYYVNTAPPDTTAGIGNNYYIQWVNSSFAFFNKSDGSIVDLTGNDWRAGNTIWAGFGGPCQFTNHGDPVVLYDQLSDRWMMSQFAIPASAPYYQCIAVSVTSDPLGSWHRYAYAWPGTVFNDYPKFGVWPDGYYMTANQFTNSSGGWQGAGVAVFDRVSMLSGGAANAQYWDLGVNYGSLLPADLDGDTLPPTNSPNYLFASDFYNYRLDIWEVSIDWATPANSTCGDANNDPTSVLAITSFSTPSNVPQPSPGEALDSLSDRLMFRAPYRNFDGHESVALSHTVSSGGRIGMRWYEIRDPGGTPVLYQEGTYAPDTNARWMGAVAMDSAGNMGLGYSVSSTSTYPSIRYTGRLASDPLGEMSQGETSIIAGTGYQVSTYNRWGDYSTMSVDPVDDCTFWYTQEYIASSGSFNWHTRIASFKFDSCGASADLIFQNGFEDGTLDGWSTHVP